MRITMQKQDTWILQPISGLVMWTLLYSVSCFLSPFHPVLLQPKFGSQLDGCFPEVRKLSMALPNPGSHDFLVSPRHRLGTEGCQENPSSCILPSCHLPPLSDHHYQHTCQQEISSLPAGSVVQAVEGSFSLQMKGTIFASLAETVLP